MVRLSADAIGQRLSFRLWHGCTTHRKPCFALYEHTLTDTHIHNAHTHTHTHTHTQTKIATSKNTCKSGARSRSVTHQADPTVVVTI